MLWTVYYIDVANSRPIRDAHRIAHRAYLDTYMSRIFFSGPLWDDAAFDQIGSLFILSLDDRDQAQAFVDHEPYFTNGVVAQVMIRPMTKGRFNPHMSGEPRERPELPKPDDQAAPGS